MTHFTAEETMLINNYSVGKRTALIAELEEMKGYLQSDESELRKLTDSTLEKLAQISDSDFEKLESEI